VSLVGLSHEVTLASAPALSLKLNGSKPLPVTSTVAVCASFCGVASAAGSGAAPDCFLIMWQF
jgi:hypothetical protein